MDLGPETELLRSSSNPTLQLVRRVAAGKEKELLLLEGERLIEDARAAGLEFASLLVDEERADLAARWGASGLAARLVARGLLARSSALEHSPGCLALARVPREIALADVLHRREPALLVVAAGIADPGNLGALARTAAAAGARALLVLPGGASPWNPKALRGSMGSLLRLAVLRPSSAHEAAQALSAAGYRQVCAATRGGRALAEFDWRGRLALWLSSETGALPAAAEGFERVSIPMHGPAESLNVSAAAAVLLFAAAEARR